LLSGKKSGKIRKKLEKTGKIREKWKNPEQFIDLVPERSKREFLTKANRRIK
jgi:hypothetical protein